jgi:hypothetical protein
MKKMSNKPIIETLVNTAALALTTFGVAEIVKMNYYGFICLSFGMGLEYFKYQGRHKKLW